MDQIFSGAGSTEESDLILNSIKGMGIPFNDMAPVDDFLKASEVNLRTANQPAGENVKALPSGDIGSLMDYLYKFQFDDWAERNKEKMGKDGPSAGMAYLDKIMGGTDKEELMNFPSFLNYLSSKGMTNLDGNIKARLLEPKNVVNNDQWNLEYQENALARLSNKKSYGPFEPNESLRSGPFLLASGVNPMQKILDDSVTNEKQAAKIVMGDALNHGINRDFEALIAPKGSPFPELTSGVIKGRSEGLDAIWKIAEATKSGANTSYIPFGYTKDHKAQSPGGKYKKIKEVLENLQPFDGMSDEERAQRLAGPQFRDPFAHMSEEERTEMAQKAIAASKRIKEARRPLSVEEELARGFVPNFAEILAAKKGEIERVVKDGKRYVQTGSGSSAVIVDNNGGLVELPSDSSYLVSQLASMAAEAPSQETTFAALGISPELLGGIEATSQLDLDDLNVASLLVNIKKLKRGSSLDLGSSSSQTGIRGASGFVPNFSAVAGEIAASQAAGYKSPVTSSQVKTMNIPGAGKAAYNTQESVFKMPGVVQPFIRPPKSSDAAPSYAKEVKKKYNFNPYPNAAGGFVPNFKGGALDTTAFEQAIRAFADDSKKFGDSTATFQTAVSGLNFSAFEKAGNKMAGASDTFASQAATLKEAASKIKDGAEKIAGAKSTSIDFKPLTSAAGLMSASAGKMAQSLGAPLDLNTKTLEDTMNNLITALGAIGGQITVDISPVTIDIQGGGAIELSGSTKDAISSDVTSIVASEINKKVPAMITSHLT